jgi:hypothetical protein
MNKTHLDQFLKLSEDDYRWKGLKPLDWWINVFGDSRTRLRSATVSRDQLKALCENPKYSDKEALAAVMAWGGDASESWPRPKTEFKAFRSVACRLGLDTFF